MDETNYLEWGLKIEQNGLLSRGPLYSLWYYFLSKFNQVHWFILFESQTYGFLPSLCLYLFMSW